MTIKDKEQSPKHDEIEHNVPNNPFGTKATRVNRRNQSLPIPYRLA